jgi:4-amino-4-deoxy-L-arabinose transferase-like glycosyltransferase
VANYLLRENRGNASKYSCLLFIVLIASFLRLYDLERSGLGNLFYASSVYSMGQSLFNFFFAAYDPMGTFIVDKPPLGLWIQTILSKVIGFNGLAMILPMSLASITAVPVLYYSSRRAFGDGVGLLAALILAILPVSVAIARDSTMDAMLMLAQLVSVAVLQAAVSKQNWRLLLLWAFIIGIGFNIKYVQVFLVLPASVLYIFLCWKESSWVVTKKLSLAFSLMALVSLSWVFIVTVTPDEARPRVMNDPDNSLIGLIVKYNGFNRLLHQDVVVFQSNSDTNGQQYTSGATRFGVGNVGLPRLFGGSNGPLLGISVLFAICGMLFLVFRERRSLRGPPVIWLAWAATGLAVFLLGNRSPVHYFESVSPVIAVLASVGLMASIRLGYPVRTFSGWTLNGSWLGFFRFLEDLSEVVGYFFDVIKNLVWNRWSFPIWIGILLGGIFALAFPSFRTGMFCVVLIGLVGHLGLSATTVISKLAGLRKYFLAFLVSGILGVFFIPSAWISIHAPRGDRAVTLPNPLEYARQSGLKLQPPWAAGSAALDYVQDKSESTYMLAVDSFTRSGDLIARFGVPILPIYNTFLRNDLYTSHEIELMVLAETVRYFLGYPVIREALAGCKIG